MLLGEGLRRRGQSHPSCRRSGRRWHWKRGESEPVVRGDLTPELTEQRGIEGGEHACRTKLGHHDLDTLLYKVALYLAEFPAQVLSSFRHPTGHTRR